MMIKVAVSDCFKLKMIPSFRSVFFPEKQEIHYIGGTDILPLPLSSEEEGHAISLLGGGQDEEGKKLLIEHNLRLVVYIAKKFDNTGVGVEDLISIGQGISFLWWCREYKPKWGSWRWPVLIASFLIPLVNYAVAGLGAWDMLTGYRKNTEQVQ